jgi:hypothetical protein
MGTFDNSRPQKYNLCYYGSAMSHLGNWLIPKDGFMVDSHNTRASSVSIGCFCIGSKDFGDEI